MIMSEKEGQMSSERRSMRSMWGAVQGVVRTVSRAVWEQCESSVRGVWEECERSVREVWEHCESSVRAVWEQSESRCGMMVWRQMSDDRGEFAAESLSSVSRQPPSSTEVLRGGSHTGKCIMIIYNSEREEGAHKYVDVNIWWKEEINGQSQF